MLPHLSESLGSLVRQSLVDHTEHTVIKLQADVDPLHPHSHADSYSQAGGGNYCSVLLKRVSGGAWGHLWAADGLDGGA